MNIKIPAQAELGRGTLGIGEICFGLLQRALADDSGFLRTRVIDADAHQ